MPTRKRGIVLLAFTAGLASAQTPAAGKIEFDVASVRPSSPAEGDVRKAGRVGDSPIPPLCFLEFDGDLTDWLVARGIATPFDSWACFHTTMFTPTISIQ